MTTRTYFTSLKTATDAVEATYATAYKAAQRTTYTETVTCDRCQGKGIKKGEIVMYAGAPGTCFKCEGRGVIPNRANQKALAATLDRLEVERLRGMWLAYRDALNQAQAELADPACVRPVFVRHDITTFTRQMEKYAKAGKAAVTKLP